jgi:putative FmdB family regulatory protein
MPIYAFECTTCNSRFDRLQKLSDPDPENCPECGKPTVKRCVTAPSFRLAGKGWYETDFKKDSDKKRNLADSTKGESKPETSSGGGESKSADAKNADTKKADAKPAEKKETKPAVKPAE